MYQNGKNIIIIDRNVNCVDALLNEEQMSRLLDIINQESSHTTMAA